MVSYKVKQGAAITEEEKRELEEAKKRPVLFDEDSPGLDPKMEQAFIEARKKKPYVTKPLTVHVSLATIKKAEALGRDYMDILGRLLDQAVNEYMAEQRFGEKAGPFQNPFS